MQSAARQLARPQEAIDEVRVDEHSLARTHRRAIRAVSLGGGRVVVVVVIVTSCGRPTADCGRVSGRNERRQRASRRYEPAATRRALIVGDAVTRRSLGRPVRTPPLISPIFCTRRPRAAELSKKRRSWRSRDRQQVSTCCHSKVVARDRQLTNTRARLIVRRRVSELASERTVIAMRHATQLDMTRLDGSCSPPKRRLRGIDSTRRVCRSQDDQASNSTGARGHVCRLLAAEVKRRMTSRLSSSCLWGIVISHQPMC